MIQEMVIIETQAEYNRRRRERYVSSVRRAKYLKNRERILQKYKEDKRVCPLCKVDFVRPYLRTHMMVRHKVKEEEMDKLLLCAVAKANPCLAIE